MVFMPFCYAKAAANLLTAAALDPFGKDFGGGKVEQRIAAE